MTVDRPHRGAETAADDATIEFHRLHYRSERWKLERALGQRDGFACHWCGTWDEPFEIDHVWPRSLGGSDRFYNLVLSCRPCNQAKRATPPMEWLGQHAERYGFDVDAWALDDMEMDDACPAT